MELPHLGKQCSVKFCNKLDFLPITCDACKNIFCDEHYTYAGHNCPKSYLKNNQVPVCPLCDKPIPIAFGQQPDVVVGAHIDNDCQADPAVARRKVFTNQCSRKGCKIKEVIPVICPECRRNFCLKHRHPQDHACVGKVTKVPVHGINQTIRDRVLNSTLTRHQNNMTEDEQLARALALSIQDPISKAAQEEMDLQIARHLQVSQATQTRSHSRNTNTINQRCTLQ